MSRPGWIILLFALFCVGAQAQTILTITGTVTLTTDEGSVLPAGVQVGDAVTTVVTFGTPFSSNFDASSQTMSYHFNDADFYRTTIGSYTWTNGTDAGAILINNDATNVIGDTRDIFSVSLNVSGTPATFPGAIAGGLASFTLMDASSPYTLVADFSLPATSGDVSFADATYLQGALSSTAGAFSNWGIIYSVDTFSITAVPEPSTAALFAGVSVLILAAVVQARRRRGV
jgi:hypothetical protein